MSAETTRRRAVDRIASAAGGSDEDRVLRARILAATRQEVSFDAHAWLLTDPETEVGSSPLAEVPCLPELAESIRLKYLTAVNRWTTLDQPAAGLHRATDGDLGRSLVWHELLARYEVRDVASMVFRDLYGCWGFLDLWRTGDAAPFTEAEIALLGDVAGPVTTALREAQARTFAGTDPMPAAAGPVVLLVSPTLEIRAQTDATDDYLRTLLPTEADRRPIPAGAYNVAAQLLAVEAGIDAHEPSTRVHSVGGAWLTLRAARVGAAGSEEQGDIAVTIEPTALADRESLFARAHGLTSREAELLGLLVRGFDTRAVAGAMFVAEYTVQDHLKSIFAKTGVRNRRTLLARVAGH